MSAPVPPASPVPASPVPASPVPASRFPRSRVPASRVPASRFPRSRVPLSTYRLQLHAGFGFAAAAAVLEHLRTLGIDTVYLSPVLQAVPGSMHGYDVLDHTVLSADLGGAKAFDELAAGARALGLGIVVDVVPNHMAIPAPESGNRPFWSVLREGRDSPAARWFDIDWDAGDGRVLLAVLGGPLADTLAAGQLTLDRADAEPGGSDGQPVLRYYDHAFPVRAGTAELPLPELLAAQHYRLASWTVADTELDYRRFFDVDTLIAVRVEDPEVFDATHRVLLDRIAAGDVDGLRIDHPDGLADPRGYLARLADATGDAWVVVEKILEHGETLPADWACAGTTGYDALHAVQGLFVDPTGEQPLRALWSSLSGDGRDFPEVAEQAKRLVATTSLATEVSRLTRIATRLATAGARDMTAEALRTAITEMLVATPVYRGYVVPGEPAPPQAVAVVEQARSTALRRVPGRARELGFVADLALSRAGESDTHAEFCVRFQQTAGPVMAKGVEDTAFYRWLPLSALAEVGGDPGVFGREPDVFHAWAAAQATAHPAGMTTLSTHDTKRSEDTRARLVVLAEAAPDWVRGVSRWRAASARYRPALLDGATESLLWQTLYAASRWSSHGSDPADGGSDPGGRDGADPAAGLGVLPADRLHAYLRKATREAKVHTTWTAPDTDYEDSLTRFTDAVLADRELLADMAGLAGELAAATRAVVLGQKLVQLTMPGVPDVYQGTEVASLSLVDPDNRRPVDHERIREQLAHLDAGGVPRDLDEEKLLVTARALRLRRELPDVFAGGYTALATGTPHAVAFLRGGRVASVVTRLPVGLAAAGGFDGPGSGGAHLALPVGEWTDVLTGRSVRVPSPAQAGVGLAGLLDRLPVALLNRTAD